MKKRTLFLLIYVLSLVACAPAEGYISFSDPEAIVAKDNKPSLVVDLVIHSTYKTEKLAVLSSSSSKQISTCLLEADVDTVCPIMVLEPGQYFVTATVLNSDGQSTNSTTKEIRWSPYSELDQFMIKLGGPVGATTPVAGYLFSVFSVLVASLTLLGISFIKSEKTASAGGYRRITRVDPDGTIWDAQAVNRPFFGETQQLPDLNLAHLPPQRLLPKEAEQMYLDAEILKD